ncbi:restriction endonuclease subunit S [Chromobacterium haemolyticum]|uniref:restriction endonuclease subunit S n=1 Tax=Chromobacterium haemolyticum TaxID=394935 RepID=UPI0040557455
MKLTEGFNLLATAPDGIKRLRELILSLAVQGKLVPQDASDEPASELLKQIRAEKDRLIAESKKAKPLPAISDDEKPFELPEGWEWVRLEMLYPEFQNGASSRGDQGGIPTTVLRLADIKNGQISLVDTRQISIKAADIEKYCLQAGDVLITRVNGSAELIGRFTINENITNAIYCDHFIRMRLDQRLITPAFLRLLGDSALVRTKISSLFITTAGQKTVNQGHINSLVLTLPPLAEQSRIVAKVEELMALCDALEARGQLEVEQHARLTATLFDGLAASESAHQLQENWARLAASFDLVLDRPEAVDTLEKTLLQLAMRGLLVPQDPSDEPASVLLQQIRAEKDRLIAEGNIKKDKPLPAIGDDEKPFELPQGWEWVALETISSVGTGTTPSRDNSAYFTPPEISWVTSGETGQPFIERTEQYVSATALRETSLTVYPAGTLIVAMYGQGKTRGQISELCIPAATNQACAAIVLPIADTCLRKYVKLYFEKIYDEIRLEAAGGAQPNLNVGKVKSTLISLPPLAEQSRIVACVEALRVLCAQLRERLATSQKIQTHLAETLVESITNG